MSSVVRKVGVLVMLAAAALAGSAPAAEASPAQPTSVQRFAHNVRGQSSYTFLEQYDFYAGGAVVFTRLDAPVTFELDECGNHLTRVSPVLTATRAHVAYVVGTQVGSTIRSCVRLTVHNHGSIIHRPRVEGGVTQGAVDAGNYVYAHALGQSKDALKAAIAMAVVHRHTNYDLGVTDAAAWHGITKETRSNIDAMNKCLDWSDRLLLVSDAASTGFAWGTSADIGDVVLNTYEFAYAHIGADVAPSNTTLCQDTMHAVGASMAAEGYNVG